MSYANTSHTDGERADFSSVLDETEDLQADPAFGEMEVGRCELFGKLSQKNPRTLIGFRLDPGEGSCVVLLRMLGAAGEEPEPWMVDHARKAAALVHPQLEHVFGIERSEHGNFWVSRFVPGATLGEIRNACKHAGMALPVGFAVAAVQEAALGLQHIHASDHSIGLIRKSAHGLLRPRSIVMTFSGRGQVLNPLYLESSPRPTIDTQPLRGNAGYLSPEAIRGQPVDPRSDVFSLAVIFHELITDRTLIRGRTPQEKADATLKGGFPSPSGLNVSLNPKIDGAVMKALSLDPAKRYANAGEFARALQEAIGEFAWRQSQRAELMGRLFPTRLQRVNALEVMAKERETASVQRAAAKVAAEEQARAAEKARIAAEARAAAEAREAKARAEAEAYAAAEAAKHAAQKKNTPGAAPLAVAATSVLSRTGSPRATIAAAVVGVVLVVAAGGWILGDEEDAPAAAAEPPTAAIGAPTSAPRPESPAAAPTTANAAPGAPAEPQLHATAGENGTGSATADAAAAGTAAGAPAAGIAGPNDGAPTAAADGEVAAATEKPAEEAPPKKKKKRVRRRDEAPIPPWLR